MSTTKTKQEENSFLDETQKAGKLTGKLDFKSLDEALGEVHVILDEEACKKIRETKEEDLPTCKMVIYCHDCRKTVPAGVGKTLRGNPRTICGTCSSKKISIGKEEAVHKFYHLDEKGESEKKPEGGRSDEKREKRIDEKGKRQTERKGFRRKEKK